MKLRGGLACKPFCGASMTISYIGKGVGCISSPSVKESMRAAVRLLKLAYFRDLKSRGIPRPSHLKISGRRWAKNVSRRNTQAGHSGPCGVVLRKVCVYYIVHDYCCRAISASNEKAFARGP